MLHQRVQVHAREHEIELAGLDLGEVEQIVDERDKVLAGGVNVPEVLAIALVAVIVLDPATAGCARLKIEISATVTLVDDADNLLNNRVAPGDIIIGIYTYDSFAVDSNPLIEVADYRYTTAPNGIRLKVNGLTFGTNPADVDFLLEVVNNYQNLDNYVVISYNNLFAVSAMGESVTNTIDWQLDDPTQTALSSTALPRTAPVLSNW